MVGKEEGLIREGLGLATKAQGGWLLSRVSLGQNEALCHLVCGSTGAFQSSTWRGQADVPGVGRDRDRRTSCSRNQGRMPDPVLSIFISMAAPNAAARGLLRGPMGLWQCPHPAVPPASLAGGLPWEGERIRKRL